MADPNHAVIYVDDIEGSVEVRYDTEAAPKGMWAAGYLSWQDGVVKELLDPGHWAKTDGAAKWNTALAEARANLAGR